MCVCIFVGGRGAGLACRTETLLSEWTLLSDNCTDCLHLQFDICFNLYLPLLHHSSGSTQFYEWHKAWNTLHDFWLSQTKDWHRETIVVISAIVAPNRWFCVVQWERFNDGRYHSLATKDSPTIIFCQCQKYSMIIAQSVCSYDPRLLTGQNIKTWHEIKATWR